MGIPHPTPTKAEAGPLDQRVLTTLQGLSGLLAFSGLRRVLGTHPESLSRSLRRLEREGLVERVDGGYRALPGPRASRPGLERDLRSIARIDLPPGMGAGELTGRLAGRWFGSLRWIGVLERPEGRRLAWARRDGGGLVLLAVSLAGLSVQVPSWSGDDDPAEAEEAAYELLYHAVEILRPVPAAPGGPVAGLRALLLGPAPPFLEN